VRVRVCVCACVRVRVCDGEYRRMANAASLARAGFAVSARGVPPCGMRQSDLALSARLTLLSVSALPAFSTKGTPSHRGLWTCSTAAANVSVVLACHDHGRHGAHADFSPSKYTYLWHLYLPLAPASILTFGIYTYLWHPYLPLASIPTFGIYTYLWHLYLPLASIVTFGIYSYLWHL
jgi:hypothetical protein